MTRRGRIIMYVLLTAVIIAFATVLYFNNPSTAAFYPRCPSKLLTGYECPGCGSLRGMHALLHGDFAEAWNFNPAIFFAILIIMLCGISGMHRNNFLKRRLSASLFTFSKHTARITDHPLFPLCILIAVIVWTILRNLI